MSNPARKKTTKDEDEVEQLLRAAQDDMLLKLSLNSHMAHSSSSAIDPDLDSRFLALKKPKQPSTTTSNHKINKIDTDRIGASEGDDLFARFTALKSSLPSHSRSNLDKEESCSIDKHTEEDENNSEEDEVEKVIKWAMDAARLDPSSPSDDDDDDDDDDDLDDDEFDYDRVQNGKKKKGKNK